MSEAPALDGPRRPAAALASDLFESLYFLSASKTLKSILEEKSLKPVAELQRRSACSFNSLFTLA
jgi:hypothetical protein